MNYGFVVVVFELDGKSKKKRSEIYWKTIGWMGVLLSHYGCNNSHFFLSLIVIYRLYVYFSRSIRRIKQSMPICSLLFFPTLNSIQLFFYGRTIRFERIFREFEIRIVIHATQFFFWRFIAFGITMHSYQHIHHQHHRQTKYVKNSHKRHIHSIHCVCFFPPALWFVVVLAIVVG